MSDDERTCFSASDMDLHFAAASLMSVRALARISEPVPVGAGAAFRSSEAYLCACTCMNGWKGGGWMGFLRLGRGRER